MVDFFAWLFGSEGFTPRTGCGPWWTPELIAATVSAGLAIALAYAAIPFHLLRIAKLRPDLGLNTLIYWFAGFISLCGATHIQAELMFIWPAYRWEAALKWGCAIASMGTVVQLPALLRLVDRKPSEHSAVLPESDLFEQCFQHAPAGIVVVGLNGELIRPNPEFCKIIRRPEQEARTIDFQTITPEPYCSQDVELFKRLIKGEIPSYAMEKPYVLPGGEQWVWVWLQTALIRHPESHQPLYVLGMVVDITQRKHAEEEVQNLRVVLEQRAAALAEKVAELESENQKTAEGAHARLAEIVEQLRAASDRDAASDAERRESRDRNGGSENGGR